MMAAAAEPSAEQAEPVSNALVVDSMENSRNALEGRCAVYVQPPDSIMFSKGAEYGRNGPGLKLTYRKKNVGGPYGQGGWIGYYTTLAMVLNVAQTDAESPWAQAT